MYMLVLETQIESNADKTSRRLVNDLTYLNHDDALRAATKHLTLPSETIFVMKTVAKCFGSMKIETKLIK